MTDESLPKIKRRETEKTTIMSVRVPVALAKRARAVCAERRMVFSSAVARALAEWVAKTERLRS